MMTVAKHSGLLLPFAVWIMTTQLGQILPYSDCKNGWSSTATALVVALGVAIASILLALIVVLRPSGRLDWFLRNLSLLIGLVLSFALLLQLVASMMVDPCLR